MKYAGTKKFIDYINNIILKFDLPRKSLFE